MTLHSGPGWLLINTFAKWPLAAAAISGCVYYGSAFIENTDMPIVSVTFDDGNYSIHEKAFPYMKSKSIVATTFPTGENIGEETYVSFEDLKEEVKEGWEVGSHTITHVDLTTISELEVYKELTKSKKFLEDGVGMPIFSFASPFGEFNDSVIDAVESVYDNHVNAYSEYKGMNFRDTFDRYNIHRLDVTEDVSAKYVCDVIKNLKNKDEWFVILFHDIIDEKPVLPDGKWQTSYEKFTTIIDCIDQSDVKDVTISEGVYLMEN